MNMAGIELWDLFKITVEGRVSPASCAWENGPTVFCAYPIKKGSAPNLVLLAEMLRSEIPIPNEIRKWLADMLDPNADSDFQFKKLSKRGRGPKVVGPAVNWAAAQSVLDLIEAGLPRKKAIHDTCGKFSIGKSAIEEALSSYKEAKAIHDSIEKIQREPFYSV